MSGSGGIQLAPPPANHQPVIRHTDRQAGWETDRSGIRDRVKDGQTSQADGQTDKETDRQEWKLPQTDRIGRSFWQMVRQTAVWTDRDERNDGETETDSQLKVQLRQTVEQTDGRVAKQTLWSLWLLLLLLCFPFGLFTYSTKTKRTSLKSSRFKSNGHRSTSMMNLKINNKI